MSELPRIGIAGLISAAFTNSAKLTKFPSQYLDVSSLMLLNLSYNSIVEVNFDTEQQADKYKKLGVSMVTTGAFVSHNLTCNNLAEIVCNRIIVGLVAGFVALVSLVGYFIWRRCQQKSTLVSEPDGYAPVASSKSLNNASTNRPSINSTSHDVAESDPLQTAPSDSTCPRLEHFPPTRRHGADEDIDLSPLAIYRVDAASVTILRAQPIAAGAYGEVWVGTCGRDTVAVKRNKYKSRAHVLKLIDEIKLLARMESPYIVSFKGVCWTHPADMECIVEYMDLGDLRSYLGANDAQHFSWEAKAQVMQSIVHGLVYLHSFNPPVIHRDLKSRNVLLDSTKNQLSKYLQGTKLTDFGESREIEDDETLTNAIGTFQWMAPEIIADNHYSVAADVYSFGARRLVIPNHEA
ncbi:protein kinase [Achlya hypogyna]|uniref:Protein kinase n=1 Tax=Achlya hypogyna TaxID=1202772 RepID=A0A1V9Z3T2_ACHHY|nr:protein kinase [Achlya hypogyna]